jgi:hypothetical protein
LRGETTPTATAALTLADSITGIGTNASAVRTVPVRDLGNLLIGFKN